MRTKAPAITERPILFSSEMVRALLRAENPKTETRRVIKPQPVNANGDTWELGGKKFWLEFELREHLFHEVYGVKGTPYGSIYTNVADRLWVRETLVERNGQWFYRADNSPVLASKAHESAMVCWAHHKETSVCVSIHMPRWASRITLELTDVRVERIQEITEADALAEGFHADPTEPEIWWEGYDSRFTDRDGNQPHCQVPYGDSPPDWLVEPRKTFFTPGLGLKAVDRFSATWDALNHKRGFSWASNPWVWVIEFKRVANGLD